MFSSILAHSALQCFTFGLGPVVGVPERVVRDDRSFAVENEVLSIWTEDGVVEAAAVIKSATDARGKTPR